MTSIKALGSDALYKSCNANRFQFKTTAELEDIDVIIGQARALDSVQFGVRVGGHGYNIFALGPTGMGKSTAVRQIIGREAADRPTPPDWCYVNDFEQPHKPKALQLPTGEGKRLQWSMEQLVEELENAIPAAFESEDHRAHVEELEEELKERQSDALDELRDRAKQQSVSLMNTPAGFAFAPIGEDDRVLSPEQFDQLPESEKKRIQRIVEGLQERLQKLMRQFPVWLKETKEKGKALNREVGRFAVNHLIDELKGQFQPLPEVLAYLDAVQKDVIEHVEEFRGHSENPVLPFGLAPRTEPSERYKVNLLVDHSEQPGMPIVSEDLPSYLNLIGRIEHRAQMGTLVTDFSLIKSGALHRANGGYLILDARQVILQPFAWDGLKRALQTGEIRIESVERALSLISTVSLEPEPIPLDLKVVLVGDRLLYYLLYEHDPEFRDLFKVAADFESSMDRSDESSLLYARLIGSLARRSKLRPLQRAAVERVIEHASRLAGDSEKMTAHLGHVADLLREADYWAGEAGEKEISSDDVQKAVDQQIRRSDRVRERIYEEIGRGTILIDTEGEVAGQVNGLSVIHLGNFAFGQPSRITVTTRLGEGEVIDIERETELGGALHSKGVLILSNFLASRYAKDHPLSIAASLVFEQSYGMVEGDSASLAELCALLSALAQLPVRQSLAVTGSVNQHGRAQAIGGVNEKIEGFFDVCNGTRLTGDQGVLIPDSNVKHLMLRHDVVKAAEKGRFHIYPVETVDDAVALLTNVPAGKRESDGEFTKDSVNRRVEARLIELSEIRRSLAREAKDREGKRANE